ncbi:HaeIII family restriction endonuclease [Lactococcus insecticola]|uniref:Type II restriction endonuclease n=1 Tax=Pseudolactococcus insecticola TaxID=2709158 RepID=A0A6A0B716_9LACT|nr:HaeIII family restriction endonuclease [Lactococcus insecticola]GFH40268.1 hypothetical protein Hs20B_06660 [Lactococcus insecticola]
MATQSEKGKAFEYATAIAVQNLYAPGIAKVIENSAFSVAQNNFISKLSQVEQKEYQNAASVAVSEMFKFEPTLTSDKSILEIKLADDNAGITGDVRDVVLTKPTLDWEIGISCKHNHTALKHQRLSGTIDFGNSWAGYPVSTSYWNKVRPIFSELNNHRIEGINWRDLSTHGMDKINDVYIPILNAFLNELNDLDSSHSDLATKFMEYLAGKNDFYKFVMNESKKTVDVYTYNLHGDLNNGGNSLTVVSLPTQFLFKGWKNNANGTQSENTLLIKMDNNWEVSLRLHSAASKVETSLKFDSQPLKLPSSLKKISKSY